MYYEMGTREGKILWAFWQTLALPPFYGNSCDPTHDISYRDPTVPQKIEMSSLFKATLMEILNQNQLRGSQEIQRYQHRKNTESDFFCNQ